jgi:hypothetical protein
MMFLSALKWLSLCSNSAWGLREDEKMLVSKK